MKIPSMWLVVALGGVAAACGGTDGTEFGSNGGSGTGVGGGTGVTSTVAGALRGLPRGGLSAAHARAGDGRLRVVRALAVFRGVVRRLLERVALVAPVAVVVA